MRHVKKPPVAETRSSSAILPMTGANATTGKGHRRGIDRTR